MSLSGKIAVVTGGGSGIGRAISVQLAKDGAAVSIWDLNGEGARETAAMIADAGGRALPIQADAFVVGKIHRHEHITVLLSGKATINTDKGMETITGPHIWISQENAKRALYTVTDCVFATVHLNPTDTTDLGTIEADVIVPEALIEYDRPKELADLTDALQGVYA